MTEDNGSPHTPKPPSKSTSQLLKEIALTGNPLAWMLMKMNEPRYEFAPGIVHEGDDTSPLLKAPLRYGLKHYRVGELRLDTDEMVTAWYKPAEKGMPTIAYCHGNAGSLHSRAAILKEMGDRGFGVLIAAYPGFKQHKAGAKVDPSEDSCIATGHAMVRYLFNRRQVPMENIVLFGESLGAAVALKTAHLIEKGIPEYGYRPENAPPVICWAAFTSLVKRAKEQFPMLPAGFLMANRFESDAIIDKIKSPILLMHGIDDDYTSHRHSVELQKASGGKAQLVLLPNCNHSCSFPGTDRQDPERIRQQIDVAQNFLHGLGLCPPAPEAPLKSDAWQGYIDRPGSQPGQGIA